MQIKLGLIINPIAGMGGTVGLKGTDGDDIIQKAIELGAEPQAQRRVLDGLDSLQALSDQFEVFTASGSMGEIVCQRLGFNYQLVYQSPEKTGAQDTIACAKLLAQAKVDLLVFAGGDGTARNILDAVGDQVPVLGIPAGCKIHSAVYTVTPTAASEVLKALLAGGLVDVQHSEVKDIDEGLFRQGKVNVKHYGEMQVPRVGQFVQATKVGGIEDESLVIDDIADYVIQELEGDELLIVGSGSTCQILMEHLGVDNTLLGVDAVYHGQLVGSDLTARELVELINQYPKVRLFITVIGGQGHIFGRGNQQLSPQVLRAIGKDNIVILASKSKLKSLNGAPLILDTGDKQLDQDWRGLWQVVTGYNDQVLYPAGFD